MIPHASPMHNLYESDATGAPVNRGLPRSNTKRVQNVSESDRESEGGMTAGSFGEIDEDFEVMMTSPQAQARTPAKSSFGNLDNSILKTIVSYLPIRDVAVCRSVSPKMHEVTQLVMPSPLPGSVFIRFENDTHRGKRFDHCPSRQVLRWTCGVCSTMNTVNVTNCRQCQACYLEGHGVRRVFFGQLRKERTAELVDWIIATVCPEVEVFHVENHTNGPDGRGKGCAWVYVTNPYDEQRLLSLNKRMFVDVDDDRREGVWYCSPDHIEDLGNMASSRAYKPNRPIVLARQPLVVERPQMKASPPRRESRSTHAAAQPAKRPAADRTPAPAAASWPTPAPARIPRVPQPLIPDFTHLSAPISLGCARLLDNGARYAHDPYGYNVISIRA